MDSSIRSLSMLIIANEEQIKLKSLKIGVEEGVDLGIGIIDFMLSLLVL